jgi:hypothetical protein
MSKCHPEQVEAMRGVLSHAEILSVAKDLNAAKDLGEPARCGARLLNKKSCAAITRAFGSLPCLRLATFSPELHH